MSIPFDKILVRHWVRLAAKQVNAYCDTISIIKKDMRIYYVHLKDSIHVRALLTNDYSIYNEYVTTCGQKEHSESIFKTLLSDWDVAKLGKIDISFDGKDFYIRNGVHRLSILFLINGGAASIPLNLIDLSYPNTTVKEIGEALKQTTLNSHYNGWSNGRKEYGYHSFHLGNIHFIGQRDPVKRLDIMRKHYDFTDKFVVDIGCNTGGMLFHLYEIKKGCGVDFDASCIRATDVIKEKLHIFNHLDFVGRDIQKEGIEDIFTARADVSFLLSMGSWLTNWRKVYETVFNNSDTIFLETNNDSEGAPQLEFFRGKNCKIVLVIEKSEDDCTNNHGRKTYMIQRA